MTEYTRRQVKWLTPIILGQLHALIMECNIEGIEKLLDQYPQIPEDMRRELMADFKRIAENQMRRKWRSPK